MKIMQESQLEEGVRDVVELVLFDGGERIWKGEALISKTVDRGKCVLVLDEFGDQNLSQDGAKVILPFNGEAHVHAGAIGFTGCVKDERFHTHAYVQGKWVKVTLGVKNGLNSWGVKED